MLRALQRGDTRQDVGGRALDHNWLSNLAANHVHSLLQVA